MSQYIVTFSHRRSIVIVDRADEPTALDVARHIAEETGHSVTVRDAQLIEIETISAPIRH